MVFAGYFTRVKGTVHLKMCIRASVLTHRRPLVRLGKILNPELLLMHKLLPEIHLDKTVCVLFFSSAWSVCFFKYFFGWLTY